MVKTQLSLALEIDQLAHIIRSLSKNELQELEIKLGDERQILHQRLNDVKTNKVRLLSKEEVFAE